MTAEEEAAQEGSMPDMFDGLAPLCVCVKEFRKFRV